MRERISASVSSQQMALLTVHALFQILCPQDMISWSDLCSGLSVCLWAYDEECRCLCRKYWPGMLCQCWQTTRPLQAWLPKLRWSSTTGPAWGSTAAWAMQWRRLFGRQHVHCTVSALLLRWACVHDCCISTHTSCELHLVAKEALPTVHYYCCPWCLLGASPIDPFTFKHHEVACRLIPLPHPAA